jgi:N-acyl-D-amino-acid deacylase
MLADVVVLDPETVGTEATYLEPCRAQQGISYVLVNGVPVVVDGQVTGATPGRVLERQRRRTDR